jgi:hypothetical protein
LVRTARPELVRRTLLLLEGSPAALERTDTLRMAAEGGMVCSGCVVRLSALSFCRGCVVLVERTLAWGNHKIAIAERDAWGQRAM